MIPSSGNALAATGFFYKSSLYNTSGKLGATNGVSSVYYKGVNDIGTATAQLSLNTKGGLGISGKLKAAAYTGRATYTFEMFGWTFEIGGTVDILGIGGEARFGLIDGYYTSELNVTAGIGLGFVIRAKPNQ